MWCILSIWGVLFCSIIALQFLCQVAIGFVIPEDSVAYLSQHLYWAAFIRMRLCSEKGTMHVPPAGSHVSLAWLQLELPFLCTWFRRLEVGFAGKQTSSVEKAFKQSLWWVCEEGIREALI